MQYADDYLVSNHLVIQIAVFCEYIECCNECVDRLPILFACVDLILLSHSKMMFLRMMKCDSNLANTMLYFFGVRFGKSKRLQDVICVISHGVHQSVELHLIVFFF